MILFLTTLAAFFALALPAHADPVSAVAGFIATALGVGAATATAIANLAIGLGASLLSKVIGKATAERPGVNVQDQVAIGDDSALSFILGDYATAGKRKYIGSWGKNTRWITEVLEFSALPVSGVQNVWFNDELGEIAYGEPAYRPGGPLMGYPVKNFSEGVGTSEERDRVWIKFQNGNQSTADAFLVDIFGDDEDYPWSPAMIGTGKAYAVVTYYYDPEVMTARPNVLIEPEPLALYDPRKDSSTGGSGSHRWGNRATYEPSRNAAVIAYNVARGIYYGSEWIFGGRNLPAWRLPRAEWVAAMTACDRAVTLAVGGTEPAYRAGLQVNANMRALDVLDSLGQAANMRFAEVGGMLKPLVDLPAAAVYAFTDAEVGLAEGQSYKPFAALGDTFNAISASYPEPAEKWTTRDAPEYIAADLRAEDGGRYLPTSISYPAVPYRRQVQRLNRAQLRDFRRMRIHQFTLAPEACGLEPLDMVSWSSAQNGYLSKLFIVESVAKTPSMKVAVTLREVNPEDYDWSSDLELPTTITTPKPVRPWVQAITGFGATAVTITDSATRARRVAIQVSCDDDEVGVSTIHVETRKLGETALEVDAILPWREPYIWNVHGVAPVTAYQVRARLQSSITPKSAWTDWVNVTTDAIYLGDDDFVDGILGLFEGAGLKATRDILDRSVPGGYEGELAWSRADNSLYEWDATLGIWIHFIAESLQGVLDETYFAASMRPPRLVVSLPASGIGVGDLVVLLSTGRLYRWTGTAWVDQNAADQIVGQLTAAQIAAGAIGVDQLAAKAMVASKVAITAFDNLVLDNQMQDRDSWGTNATATWVTHNPNGGVTTAQAQCRGTFVVNPRPDNTLTSITSDWASISPGDEIFASCRIGATAAHSSRLILQFADLSGAILGAAAVAKTSMTWGRISTSGVAPEGAVLVRIVLRVDDAGYAAGGSIVFSQPVMRRKGVGELIVDGTIRGTHIVVGTLTGGLLASTGIITGSAQIDGAVITRAHIQTLAVDTLRLADNAVTVPVGATNSSDLRLYPATGEVTLLSVSMVREGAPTMLWATAQIGGYITSSIAMFRLYRDSTLIAQFPSVSGNDGAQTSASFAFRDANLGTGATTYSLRVERFTSGEYTGDPQIVNRSLVAMHVKK
ncbi:phage tail protein [Paracoccus sp. MBLB3053]|uniref:Phage tail protein n=1 Tax=Paracoccus aurantius TaxID=3073814 RepID=A0ABU2HU65_9RHOB|nr:phage tail protein [Paracoccus sp. MBLB3053]MDS9468596.1 phage tail protein [Paracoccus sp. MBLB3053]